MKRIASHSGVNRRILLSTLAALPVLPGLHLITAVEAQQLPKRAVAAGLLPEGPLASWRDGPAKQAITRLRARHYRPGKPKTGPPRERIATFDQDGTLWVEQPTLQPTCVLL